LTGLQITAWWANFYGADLRLRIGKKHIDGGLGSFAKLPIPLFKIGHM
jgi:hypothetical protein